MSCSRMLLLSAPWWLVFVYFNGLIAAQSPDATKAQERELIEALQEVLEHLKSQQTPSLVKKLGWVPSCDAGEVCAERKGSRIGTLCGCPRGTMCNFNVLKCL